MKKAKKRQKIQRPTIDLSKIDFSKITDSERKRIERALNRRDTTLALRFRQRDIATWREAAERQKLNITDWVEKQLNIAATDKV